VERDDHAAEERALARRLADGDEAAFAALFDRFGGRLYGCAFALLGNRQEAEDAVQDVFASLVRSRRSLAGVENLPAYLFAALRRTAGRALAARNGRPRAWDVAAHGEPATQPSGLRDELREALAALPREQREVVTLKIDGGLTFTEIAAVLEIGANTAASRYRYALEKLRAALSPEEPT
jgi:RNA polymerase sigma-70 factor (ECF subfamily)